MSDERESWALRWANAADDVRSALASIRAKCEHHWVVDGDEVEYCTHCGVSPEV